MWYKGQPLVCNLCSVQGHKSANCPNKDRCRLCGKNGHFGRQCCDTWNGGAQVEAPVANQEGSGVLDPGDLGSRVAGPIQEGSLANVLSVEEVKVLVRAVLALDQANEWSMVVRAMFVPELVVHRLLGDRIVPILDPIVVWLMMRVR